MEENKEVQLDLSRKYRPKVLEDYIGNEKMVATIRSAFDRKSLNNVPHKIMLTGPTGCGKTTMARILVRSFMCENPQHGMPCEECDFCKASRVYAENGDDSQLADLTEVDVTHTRSVSDIEPILDTMQYEPTTSKYSVFLFDEFHAASQAAQNAMLKSIEDLGDSVVVIFCTTDKDKVLPTLINRMSMDLTVVKPPMVDLMNLMGIICQKEGYKWDKEGLRQLSIYSNFIIRASLMNLERVLRSKEGASGKAVADEFDIVSDGVALDFIESLVLGEYAKFQNLLYELELQNKLPTFMSTLEAVFTRGILVMNGVAVEGLGQHELDQYAKVFNKFSEEQIAYVLALLTRNVRPHHEAVDLLTIQYDITAKGKGIKDEGKVVPVKEDEGAIQAYARGKREEARIEAGNLVKEEAIKEVSLSDLL